MSPMYGPSSTQLDFPEQNDSVKKPDKMLLLTAPVM